MFPYHWIVLFHFHFIRCGSFILVSGVIMASASTRNQFDFIPHSYRPYFSLNFDALFANIGQHGIDSQFINDSHTFRREAQLYKPILRFNPKSVGMNIR